MNNNYSYAVAAVGTQQLITERYPIASVSVDNPSGMWLYLPELYSFVPPMTLGWSLDIAPPVSNLRVQYVTSPANGIASTVTGGPIIITTYDRPQGSSAGLNYTVATQADIAVLSAKIDTVIANGNGLKTWTISAITVNNRAGYGNHNLSIGFPPYAGNLFIEMFNNDLANPIYVLDADTDLPAAGRPIYPHRGYAVNIVAGATMQVWVVCDVGITADMRLTYGTYS